MTMKTEGKRKRTIEVVEETGGEGERQRSEPAAVEVNVDVVGEETGGQRLVPAGDNEASGRGGAEGKRKRTGPTAIEVVEETGGEGERQRSEPAAVEVVEEENVDAVGEETGGQRLVPAGDNEASGRGGIHDDLVHEVISWMPARDAARFTALSSKWGKILHNPNFWISDHRAAPNEVRITYCLNDSQPQDREFAFHDFPDSVLGRSFPLGFGYRYFGTMNGLLALQVSHMVNPKFSCCIVFNPASNLDASFIFLGVNSSYRCCGFGYSDISQKYKVLIHGAGRLLVETLGDDQGGEPRILCSDSTIRYDPSICLGDTIYVLENTEGSERVPRLMAFAVLSEIVSTVELPVAGQALHSGLMVMTGSLCVATRGSTDEVLLWRHKAQEGWEKVAVLKAVSPGRVLGAWTHVSLKKVLRTWTYEVKLLLWFEDYGAVLYQKDGGGDGEFQLVWSLTFQDHFDSSREDLRHETANINLAVCWAFRPTLISPMALIGSSQANHRILMALVKRHHIPTAPPLSFVKCIAEVLGGNQ